MGAARPREVRPRGFATRSVRSYAAGYLLHPTNERVARLMAQAGLGEAPAIPQQTKKNQPKKKAQERLAEKAEKAKATEEAAA